LTAAGARLLSLGEMMSTAKRMIEEEMSISQLTNDAIHVMRQVGKDFANTQRDRWKNNEWRQSIDVQRERIDHWKRINNRIGELCDELKETYS
jgi:hypothetical protein